MDEYSFSQNDVINCIALDQKIKKLSDKVAEMSAKKLTKLWTREEDDYLKEIRFQLSELQSKFAFSDCRNAVEYKRMVDSAQITVSNLKAEEDSVEITSVNNDKLYMIIGASVLLIGFFVLLKKRK